MTFSDEFLLDLLWGTRDGRLIPIRDMNHHHAWNALRMNERRGGSTIMHDALALRVGQVSRKRYLTYRALNLAYDITHVFSPKR